MSIGSLARRMSATDNEEPATRVDASDNEVAVSISLEPWRRLRGIEQFDTMVRRLARRSGFRDDRAQVTEGAARKSAAPEWVVIAPGIAIRSEEYRERFEGIDLEGLRGRMSPGLFLAYVRHLGVVRGRGDLDTVEMSRVPDER